MKISVNKILYHWYSKVYSDWTSSSVQVSLLWEPQISFDFWIDLNGFSLGICNLLILRAHYKKDGEDHAGFMSQLHILGLDLEIERVDTRHWDYDNKCWEESGDTIEEMNNRYYEKFPERK